VFQISADIRGLPDHLRFATLPVDIVRPDGQVIPRTLTISPSETFEADVDAPGQYSIRVELPSGAWIATSVWVPGSPEQVAARGILNFGQSDRELLLSRALSVAPMPALRIASASAALGKVHFYVPEPSPAAAGSSKLALRDSASSWHFGVANVVPEEQLVSFPELFDANMHPGITDDVMHWKPAFCVLAPDGTQTGETVTSDALIVVPPTRFQTVTIVSDSIVRDDADAPAFAVSTTVSDQNAGVLFQYMRNASPHRARVLVDQWMKVAETALKDKIDDPVSATLGAYVLLALGDPKRRDWVINLASWFSFLPDGAIIAGWHAIRQGDHSAARLWFRTALERGIPMFSQGIRLLQDGCAYLHGLDNRDVEAARLERIAYRLASFANLRSELTTLVLRANGLSLGPDPSIVSAGDFPEFKSRVSAVEKAPAFRADPGFETLFDGRTFGDWKMSTIRNQPGRDDPGAFVIRHGALEAHPGTDIGLLWLARPTPSRFVLRLQWMMTSIHDISGVFVGFPHPEEQGYNNTAYVAVNFGFEVEIGGLARPGDALNDGTGAIYVFKSPGEVPLMVRPVGEWNQYEITVDGSHFTTSLNDHVVSRFHFTGDPRSPLRGLPSTPSDPRFIGLQTHTGTVLFRHIQWKQI
jgi:hypothetical protein